MNRTIIQFFILLLLFPFTSALGQEDGECAELQNKKAIKTYNEAFELFRDRKLAEASQKFKEVTVIEPLCAKPYFFLGLINFKKADYNLKAAENYFLKTIELCPEYEDIYVYYYLGDIFSGKEDWSAASKYLKKFLEDPEKIDSDQDFNRATALLKYAQFYDKSYSNPVPFAPRYLQGVSSMRDEYLPSMSPDGSLAFFTRVIEIPPNKNDLVPKASLKEKFYYSQKKNGVYDDGQEMPPPFNQNNNEGGASVTIDNRELFYTVCRDQSSYFNCDICYSRKDEFGYWSEIEVLPEINNPDTWEAMPSISSDGKTLFFISDRPGGLGGYDIYYSVRDEAGVWSAPKNIGAPVNTSGNEKTPFLHTDSQTLYFSSASESLQGLGGYDIFYSRLQVDGKWSKPVNIGYPINSEGDDTGFFVNAEGNTGYFASNKLKGPGGWDIYSFELYESARPEAMAIVTGEIKEEKTGTPVNARIEIKNVETKKITYIPVDSLTGQYSAAIRKKSDYILTVKKPDHAYESKYLFANDTLFQSPEPPKIDFKIKEIEVGESYKLNDIFFATNSFELTPESKIVLDGFIEFLQENMRISVAIHGHTDNIGDDAANLILSENRARSVYAYLTENGIASQRLSYKGYGETKPVASNSNEAGRAKNRRTEFVIINK